MQSPSAANATLSLIEQSLSLAAERCEDLTPRVYQTFYQRCPEASRLFQGKPESAPGKMLNELLRTVTDLCENKNYIHTLLETEISDHQHWGVTAGMYMHLFNSVLDTFADLLGSDWSPEMAQAWSDQFQRITQQLPA